MKDQIEQHCKDILTRQKESMKTDIVKAIDKAMDSLKTDIIEAIDAPRSYWVQTFPCVMFTNSPLWCTHFRETYFKPVHACMHRSIMYIVMKIMSLDFLLWLYYQKWVWPDHGSISENKASTGTCMCVHCVWFNLTFQLHISKFDEKAHYHLDGICALLFSTLSLSYSWTDTCALTKNVVASQKFVW